MGFYTTTILPGFMDKMTSGPETEALRKEALAPARGRLLEIGFGTGRNIPHFPSAVTHVVGLDPNPGVEKIARPRIDDAPLSVEFRIGAGEQLPFPDGSFDTVVTFLVLCSVKNPEATLKEIRRVLAPGGSYLLVEHGLAPDANVQKWQRRINGLNKMVLGGCNLNRPIRQMVTTSGFTFQKSREFFQEKAPKFAGFTTLAVAAPIGD